MTTFFKTQIDSIDLSEFEIQFEALVGRTETVQILNEGDFWTTILIEIECDQEEDWAKQLIDELSEAV